MRIQCTSLWTITSMEISSHIFWKVPIAVKVGHQYLIWTNSLCSHKQHFLHCYIFPRFSDAPLYQILSKVDYLAKRMIQLLRRTQMTAHTPQLIVKQLTRDQVSTAKKYLIVLTLSLVMMFILSIVMSRSTDRLLNSYLTCSQQTMLIKNPYWRKKCWINKFLHVYMFHKSSWRKR